MQGILCHEGANLNGYYFYRNLMEVNTPSILYKYVNIEHKPPIVGVVTESSFVAEEKAYISFTAYLWKYVYKDIVDWIKANYANKNLRISMELWCSDYEYIWGDEKVTKDSDLGKKLSTYVGREYEEKPVYVAFLDYYFGGLGVVKYPADQDALILKVAERQMHPLREYHDRLHREWEIGDNRFMSEQEIIEEHRRVHQLLKEGL